MALTTSAYYIDFKSNTNYGGSGSIVSPVFDSESAGFATAWSNYVATVTTPTGSSITWTFRAADTTAALSAASYSSSISSLSGRYFQAKAVITKDDVYSASSGAIISDANFYARPQGKAVMIEEATTNLAFYSQEIDNAYWTKLNATVLANSAIAPDGTATADKFTDDTTNGQHRFSRNTVLSTGSAATFSIHAKAGELSYIWININGSDTAWFNASNGTVGTVGAGITSTSIKYAGNGWYRCSVSYSNLSAGGNVIVGSSNADNVSSYAGTSQSIYLWGAQAEAKAYPTSYTPTTTASATRNAEVITIPSGGIFDNANVGSAIIRFKLDSTKDDNQAFLDLGSTGTSGFILFREPSAGKPKAQFGQGTGSAATVTGTTTINKDSWYTVGYKWGSTGMKIWMNGSFEASGSVAPNIIPLATYTIGGTPSSALRYLNGLMSDCVIYREELTDAEMASYTATGAVIPLDYRTTYKLDFEGNLYHGEGGSRVTTALALDQVGTITSGNIIWTETESSGALTDFEMVQGTKVAITNGNDVQNTQGGGAAFDAGAIGSYRFESGQNFYVQWTTAESSTSKVAGLTNTASLSADQNEIDFGIYMKTSTNIDIVSNGSTLSSNITTYAGGNTFRLDVIDNVVKFYKNNSLVYTFASAPVWPLFFDVSFLTANGTVNDCQYGFYPKVDIDTSIDNGSTWYAATSASAITGLSSEVSATGKTLKIRQKLTTPRSATAPVLSDMTVKIGEKTTGNYSEYVKPLWTTLTVTPTNTTKFQLENKPYSTSFMSGTRNAEYMNFSNACMPSGSYNNHSVVVRAYFSGKKLDADITPYTCTLFDTHDTTSNNYHTLERSTTVLRFITSNAAGANHSTSATFSTAGITEGWHTIGYTISGNNKYLYINGSMAASGTSSNVPAAWAGTLFSVGNYRPSLGRQWNDQISHVNVFREALTNAEMIAYTAASGAVVPVDYRTAYVLNFEDNLIHSEAGYRVSPSYALDNIADISSTDVTWVEVPTASGTVTVQSSVDAGSNWTTLSNGGSISGLTGTGVGKAVMFRQILTSTNAASFNPAVSGMIVKIGQTTSSNYDIYIKPVFDTLTFIPTNLTKFQLENKKFSTSFIEGTRVAETLTFPADEVIYASSGAVVVRAYIYSDAANASASGQHFLFDTATGAAANRISIFRDTTNWKAQMISSGGVTTTITGAVVSAGLHTFGINWTTGSLQLWIDGSMASSGVPTLISTVPTSVYVGSDYAGTKQTNYPIFGIDIFGENLTSGQMTTYTAASGYSIPVEYRHTYKMDFNSDLEYGLAGSFTSRWHDSGANTAGTPYITFTKSEVKPAGTDIKYFFKASDSQDDSVAWSEDITTQTGRYMKVKVFLLSDDVNAYSPSVSAIRFIPQYS